MIEKLTIRINPEDSVGVGIMEFYNRVAAALDLDPATLCYDVTKISKNIQSNIFEVLDAKSSDSCFTGMLWALRGPKTDERLPDNTVEISRGFLLHNEEPLDLYLSTKNIA